MNPIQNIHPRPRESGYFRNKTLIEIYSICILYLGCCITSSAQTWSALGAGIDTGNNVAVYCLAMYNGELYAGGTFSKAGGNSAHYIAKWDGTNWSPMGQGMSGYVYTLCVYNGKLYAGGSFNYADGKQVNCIARWTGTSWDSVGRGMDNIVRVLYVFKGELYAGGDFITAGGVSAQSVAKWNDTSWTNVGSGITPVTGAGIVAFASYNNELYAGGYFDYGKFQHIAKWDGANWDTVGQGFNTGMAVLSLCQYKGELYAGGDFGQSGTGANRIARWNGTVWDSVGHGFGGAIFALASYNNALYCEGTFTGWGLNHIAKWDGTNWSALASGVDIGGFGAFAVDTTTNSLYVGGGFTTAGGIPALKVAKWTDLSGVNELANNNLEFTIYPNPAHSELNIAASDNKKYTASVKNILGQTLMGKSFVGSISFDVTTWVNGMYIIELRDEKGMRIRTEKVVIE